MAIKWLKILLLVFVVGVSSPAVRAQRIIEYVAGMGTRDQNNPDIWILYQNVKAMHEGMTLFTDSASLDTKNNIFVAHRNVKILLTDTTTLYGTTDLFLRTMQISSLSELPPLPEIASTDGIEKLQQAIDALQEPKAEPVREEEMQQISMEELTD